MARPNKIEQFGLGEKVLALSVTKTSREIAAILKEENGVDISHAAIARYIQDVRKERVEATRAAVQEHIKATLPGDLQLLDEIIAQEREWFKDPSLKISQKLLVAKELRQAIDTKLRHSGASEASGVIVVQWSDD